MKATIYFLLIALACTSALAVNVTEGAGIAFHVQQSFFTNLKTSLLDEYIRTIETGKIEDILFSHDFGMGDSTFFKVFLNLTNMELHEFGLDTSASYLELHEAEPNLELFISDLNMKATLDFHFGTEPYFLDDHGDGHFYLGKTSIRLGYAIERINGRPTFVTKSATVDSEDFSLVLDGSADFSRVITQMSAALEQLVKTNINDYILGVVDATITPLINGAITSKYNLEYKITDDVVIDLSSSVDPIFTDEHMSLFFKAAARQISQDSPPFRENLRVPSEVDTSGRQLQIGISDFIFNSTLYSLFKTGFLKLDTQNFNGTSFPVPASNFFIIFPTLAEKYGAEDDVFFRVTVQETVNPPYVEIVDGYLHAYLDCEIEMYTKRESLLTLQVDSYLELDAYIVKGFLLTLDLRQFRLRVREITQNNIDPNLDNRDIAAFFGLFSGFFRNYVNQFVKNFEVRLPVGDSIDLSQVSMYTRDFYIYADITPYFR